MKLVSLNVWHGRVFDRLMDFIREYSEDVDIFCFQEVFSSSVKHYKDKIMIANLLERISKALPDFQCIFSPNITGFDCNAEAVDFDLEFGLAIFVRRSIKLKTHGSLPIHEFKRPLNNDWSNFPTILQHMTFVSGKKEFTICNFHGTPRPGSKLDSKLRLEQSNKIKEFIGGKTAIVAGDFNLLPSTESIRILEDGMKNLIKEFKIERTRSDLNIVDGKIGDQMYADYVFTTKDVDVQDFQAIDVEVSDHLPLLLEFS